MNQPQMCELQSICGRRYRLTGGDVAADWAPRDGREVWCELTVSESRDSAGGYHGHLVTSYGGEVWPAAWPRLFRNEGRNRVVVTDEGKRLLGL